MRITNKTRGTVLSENARLASSFYARLKGLMFAAPADIVLESPAETIKHSSIHMFFMRYPIDVLWVSSSGIVVDSREKLAPARITEPKTWAISKPRKPAKYVIELGKGSLQDTQIGDEIEFA
ncbi:MAG: DUF192 domain-containing protein [Candidatus Altiarchaeota archaeon]